MNLPAYDLLPVRRSAIVLIRPGVFRRWLMIFGGLVCIGAPAYGQEAYGGVRDLVQRAQADLVHAQQLAQKSGDRKRIDNAQKRLSDFDRSLSKGKFDKSRMNKAIDDMQSVLDHNTL